MIIRLSLVCSGCCDIPSFRFWRCTGLLALLMLAGCGSSTRVSRLSPSSPGVTARIIRLMPQHVTHKADWANDIYTAFRALSLETSNNNLCSVVAIIDQESGFNADAPVAGLPAIAWGEIERRAAKLMIPAFMVHVALSVPSSSGESYGERIDKVRTEKELSAIFDDLIDRVPMGQRLFGHLNPVHTGGPMQVSIAFAETNYAGYPYPMAGSVRQAVFSQRGGIYFGIRHLLGYPAPYSQPLYRFADFNAGWYASRNAAFQAAVSQLSGIKLVLDGDLVLYDSDQTSATEKAVQSLRKRLDLSESAIRSDLEKGHQADFQQTLTWQRLFSLADRQARKSLPRERLPGITLQSPKITRNLTTAWFAKRVDARYQRCMAQ